jgi:tetratricopeptide (TPR) repeat protein
MRPEIDPGARRRYPLSLMQEPLPELPPRYRCLQLIGDGATGHVFLARDLELGSQVAVKVVRRNLAMHQRFRARFAREVALSAGVVHENLVPVHDSGTLADGRPFVALAFANRGNLRKLLRASLRLPVFLDLIEQTCEALAALHARGLVHQDLKPANILLHEGIGGLKVWVADLGVADDVSELARDARRVGGTPTYMAPEQLQGKPQEVGPWTDLYALGIIFFEALCGKRPHEGDGRKALLEARLGPPPEVIPIEGLDVPDELVDLVGGLLDPEPRQRYDRAADVRRALRRIRRGLEDTSFRKIMTDITGRRTSSSGVTETGDTTPAALAWLQESNRGGVGQGVRWNQVPPEAIPPHPPFDAGLGAPARASLSLFALREVPLIARETPRQLIWKIAREVVTLREPRVVLIVGERGAGKTRLVESVARSLDEGGWMETVRLRYHDPPGIDDGYRGAVRDLLAPWNDTRLDLQGRLARWLARDRRMGLTDVLAESGHLARWCGYLLENETAPNAALGLTFLYRHLEARAWRGGSCLVLEDAENAEAEGDGLAIAESLLDRSVGDRPVLVLATVSAEELARNEDLKVQVERLQELGATRLGLPRLTRQETRQLLSEALLLEPALADQVATRVAGYPLLATMLLQDWAARGWLVAGPGMRFELKPGLGITEAVPADIETLCLRRLESAVQSTSDPTAASEALAAVALAGEAPPVSMVRMAARVGMDLLLSTGILHLEAGLVRFPQSVLQRTARRLALSLPEAPRIHERLAESWEELGEQTGMDVDLALGLHRLRAGKSRESLVPLQRAVRTMIDQGRYAPAIRAADLCMAAADLTSPKNPLPKIPRLEARRLKARALLEGEQYATAVELLEATLSDERTDRLYEARLKGLLGAAKLSMGQMVEARALLDNAHESFRALRDTTGRAQVAFWLAQLSRQLNNLDQAADFYRESMGLTEKESRLGVQVIAGLATVYLLLGRVKEARDLADELIWAAQATGDTRNIAQANYMIGMVYLGEGGLEEADRVFRTARALAATCGDYRMQLNCMNNLGEVARYAEDYPQALKLYEEFRAMAHGRGYVEMEAIANLNLAMVGLMSKNFRGADQYALTAGQVLAKHQQHWAWLHVAAIRAACAARAGNRHAARQWWNLARERGVRHMRNKDVELPLEVMYEAARKLGWSDLVRDLERTQMIASKLSS